MNLKISTKQFIEVADWDRLVDDTYGKPYSLQQQDGCMDRGTITLRVPIPESIDTYPEEIPLEINSDEMGVKFETWLNTSISDISSRLPESYSNYSNLFWERNFYPNLQILANDLHSKGLIDEGEYLINIDW